MRILLNNLLRCVEWNQWNLELLRRFKAVLCGLPLCSVRQCDCCQFFQDTTAPLEPQLAATNNIRDCLSWKINRQTGKRKCYWNLISFAYFFQMEFSFNSVRNFGVSHTLLGQQSLLKALVLLRTKLWIPDRVVRPNFEAAKSQGTYFSYEW